MRMILLPLAALLLSGLPASARAWQPPCAEVLRLDPVAFSERFTLENDDGSEVGQDRAADSWAGCRRRANLARLTAYPRLRARLEKLRALELQLLGADSDLAYQREGGGTMYSHGLVRAVPFLELHLNRLIDLTTTRAGAGTSPAIRERQAQAVSRIEARLRRIKHPTRADLAYTNRADWARAAAAYEAAYRGIVPIAGPGVNTASLEVYGFVARGLFLE